MTIVITCFSFCRHPNRRPGPAEEYSAPAKEVRRRRRRLNLLLSKIMMY